MTVVPAPTNKAELIARIDRTWSRLEGAFEGLSDAQLTAELDADRWNAKDHLAHIAAWERSIVYLLQGKPRHEGLGIQESVYLSRDTDTINTAIHEASRDLVGSDVLALVRATHEQLRTLVAAMSDEDLQKSYTDFLPDDAGADDGQPIIARIFRATTRHFDAHQGAIEEIAARQ
ncbi:MAG: ClbS/DfsB family four-helix bundle protein [Chloroflexia bacterium]|nr:ClbS/DfsB family four-helix bundle protein [Chloroflexia bacterium]